MGEYYPVATTTVMPLQAGERRAMPTAAARGDTDIAAVAALLADPTRATILITLCDGRALPAGELARHARVAPSTMSGHLSKLLEAGLIGVEAWGRHRYFRLANPDIVRAIETLAVLAPEAPIRSLRQSQAAAAVRYARICYDHLAGYVGVRLTQALVDTGSLAVEDEGYSVTADGAARLCEFGLDMARLRRHVVFAPYHVDWSERRHHLAGPLAVALTKRLFELGWITRSPSSRAVRVTPAGETGLQEWLALQL